MKTKAVFGVGVALLGAAASLLAQPRTVLWTYDAPWAIYSSPALAPDGTIYISAAPLLAITNSGSSASNTWSFPRSGAPAVGSDGTIYCITQGLSGGGLYAINYRQTSGFRFPIRFP